MSIYFPDMLKHNNPNLALVDSNYVRGGRRVVADLTALYALYAIHSDQMAENLTIVYVIAEEAAYQLVDVNEADNEDGWAIQNLPTGVSSVGLSLPNIFQVSNTPVISTGILTANLAQQAANKILAGPITGSDAVPTFRILTQADIPQLDWSKIISGTLPGTIAGYGITDAVNSDEKAEPLGVATLDVTGKIPLDQMPDGFGNSGLVYKGTWDASSNDPVLSNGSGVLGEFYLVSVTGTYTLDGESSWAEGDVVLAGDTAWSKVTNMFVVGGGAVDSVFGRTGAVVKQAGDYDFADLGTTPTTLSGYGITDGVTPTELADAILQQDGVSGSNTMTPGNPTFYDISGDHIVSVNTDGSTSINMVDDTTGMDVNLVLSAGKLNITGLPVNIENELYSPQKTTIGIAPEIQPVNNRESLQVLDSMITHGFVTGQRLIEGLGVYNVQDYDYTIRVDATSQSVNINLMADVSNGAIFIIKKIDASVNPVTIIGTNIDGANQIQLPNQYDTKRFQRHAGGWDII